MKKCNFEYIIPDEYFKGYRVITHYKCAVFYLANSLGNITLTMIGFDPYMPMISNVLYSRLVAEIELAAKDHYDSLGIEQPDYNDIEMQEKYLSAGD